MRNASRPMLAALAVALLLCSATEVVQAANAAPAAAAAPATTTPKSSGAAKAPASTRAAAPAKPSSAAKAPAKRASAAKPSTALSTSDLQELMQASTDSSKSADVVRRLRAYLAGKPDSQYIPLAHVMIVQALIAGRAPAATVIVDAERAIPYLPNRPEARTPFYFTIANYLIEKGGPLDTALLYANRALSEAPEGENYRALKSIARQMVGRVQIERGQYAEAIGQLEMAVSDAPDSQSVLFQLGRAYEKAGRDEDAERAYLRSLAVFAATDTSAAAPLRAIYAKRHGSLAGLDSEVTRLRRASREGVALTTQRMDKPAPDWTLPDLEGKPVALASFKGKVVVLDFWGSWCGPCRQELPKFEALYRRYRGNPNVAFVGVNWERVQSAEMHLALAKRYMEENKYTFPMVYDHDRVAVEGYKLEAFPTVFLIDKSGTIRYRDVGYTPGIDAIIEAQLESLLE